MGTGGRGPAGFLISAGLSISPQTGRLQKALGSRSPPPLLQPGGEAVLALIHACYGSPASEILSSILDQPSPLWLGDVWPRPPFPSLLLHQTAHTCDCDGTSLRDLWLKDKQWLQTLPQLFIGARRRV